MQNYNFTEIHYTEFVCAICNRIVGDDTKTHAKEAGHYEFIGQPMIKRNYIVDKDGNF